MQLKPEEISKVIRSQIKYYENAIQQNETGTILMVGDGIARALVSTGRNSFVSIGPAPSIGCPRALTTRPIIASPTGTDTTLPVRFTV